jgi:GDP-L-fucose synthase
MKKILLTGSTGFLGRHIKLLVNKKFFKIYDCNSTIANLENVKNLYIYNKIKFDYIFHFATKTKAGNYSKFYKGEQWLGNQLINTNILFYWKNFQPQAKMVAMGSSCMYSQNLKMSEDSCLEGPVEKELYTYAMTKRMLFLGIKNFNEQYKLKYLFLIPSVFYGPNYDLNDNHFIFDFIRKIYQAKNSNSEVKFFGTGKEKRDLIFIKDAVNCIFSLLKYNNQVFNLASGKEETLKSYAYKIADLFQYNKKKIKFSGKNNGSVKSRKLLINKLKNFVLKKNINVDLGLLLTVNYFKDNINEFIISK